MTKVSREKAALRQHMREVIRSVSSLRRPEASAQIVAHLGLLLPTSGVVALYAALPDEPDVDPLLAQLASEGRLALPRVDGDQLRLHLVTAHDKLDAGSFQIREPSDLDPTVAPEDLALAVIPGRSFDAAGRRLGRGGGHYDRLLAQMPASVRRLGVAFSEQIVARVPTDSTDQPVHGVVTPQGLLAPGPVEAA